MITETAPSMAEHRVPFTVIGGFLGAGKTSLVNHLLASAEQRYAVLVNDFGALNIDARLIRQHQGDTIALANGCICCSLAAGFSKGLGQVLDKLENFDHVIVEASGIADPGRIQDIARIEPGLEVRGNPVMVDARQLIQQAQDPHIGSLIHQQIAAADLLIINKHGELTAADARALARFLEQLSDVQMLYTDWGRVKPEDLLELPARPGKFRPLLAEALNHGLYSQILKAETPLQYDRFTAWAGGLSADILRGKGLVQFSDRPGTWLWQKVGDQIQLTGDNGEDSVAGCELVLISKRKESLPNCF